MRQLFLALFLTLSVGLFFMAPGFGHGPPPADDPATAYQMIQTNQGFNNVLANVDIGLGTPARAVIVTDPVGVGPGWAQAPPGIETSWVLPAFYIYEGIFDPQAGPPAALIPYMRHRAGTTNMILGLITGNGGINPGKVNGDAPKEVIPLRGAKPLRT